MIPIPRPRPTIPMGPGAYGYGPSPTDVAFQGWGNSAAPAPPGSTTWSLPGGTYGQGASVPDSYAGSFSPGGFFAGLGNLAGVGVEIWDRLRDEEDPRPVTVQPQAPVMAGMGNMGILLLAGVALVGFMMLRK